MVMLSMASLQLPSNRLANLESPLLFPLLSHFATLSTIFAVTCNLLRSIDWNIGSDMYVPKSAEHSEQSL
jgi:hypothetical protein